LQRVATATLGNAASSWGAAAPTPGRFSPPTLPGDFDANGVVDAVDINLLFEQLRSPTPDTRFDLTGDGAVDDQDRDTLILEILDTTYGDANLDGIFDSNDLIRIFVAGKYEDGVPLNALWEEGDWDGDGECGTADLVLAFQTGGYESPALGAAKPAVSAVDLSIALLTDELTTRTRTKRPGLA
jgi:hypothetical protein